MFDIHECYRISGIDILSFGFKRSILHIRSLDYYDKLFSISNGKVKLAVVITLRSSCIFYALNGTVPQSIEKSSTPKLQISA